MKYIISTKHKNFQKYFKKILNSKRQQSEINRSVVLKIIEDEWIINGFKISKNRVKEIIKSN